MKRYVTNVNVDSVLGFYLYYRFLAIPTFKFELYTTKLCFIYIFLKKRKVMLIV